MSRDRRNILVLFILLFAIGVCCRVNRMDFVLLFLSKVLLHLILQIMIRLVVVLISIRSDI